MYFLKRIFFIGIASALAVSVSNCRETNKDAEKPADTEGKEGVNEVGNEFMETEEERTTSPYPMDNTDSIPKDSTGN